MGNNCHSVQLNYVFAGFVVSTIAVLEGLTKGLQSHEACTSYSNKHIQQYTFR